MFSWILMLWVAGLSHGLVIDQQTDTSVLKLLVQLEADVNDLKAKNKELEELCTRKQSSTHQKPAFLATLSHKIEICTTGTPVIFDHVVLNQRSGYDYRHGVFRAPRNGTYQFSSTLTAYPNKKFFVGFVKNLASNYVGYLFADMGLNHWQGQSTSVIVHLNAGDDVWMSCIIDSQIGGNAGGAHTDYHSHFSGFMISED